MVAMVDMRMQACISDNYVLAKWQADSQQVTLLWLIKLANLLASALLQ